jgi:hypothetical protein
MTERPLTEAQFELLLAATREQYQELRAIHDALGRLRGISYALYIILGIIILGIIASTSMMIRLAPAWLALRHVQFW